MLTNPLVFLVYTSMLQTLVSVSNPFQLYRASFQFGSDCSDCNDTAVATESDQENSNPDEDHPATYLS